MACAEDLEPRRHTGVHDLRAFVPEQHNAGHVLQKDPHHPPGAEQIHVVVEVEPLLAV